MRHLNRVRWKYKNSMFLIAGAVVTYVIVSSSAVDALMSDVGAFGYVWSLVFGFFHAFSVTVVPSTALLYKLGREMNPLTISLIAAAGAVVGDYFVYAFVKNELFAEFKMLGEEIGGRVGGEGVNRIARHTTIFYRIFPFSNMLLSKNIRVTMFKLSKSRVWRGALIVVSSIMIMMPLPSEIGVTLLGLLDFDMKHFLAYVYVVSFVGIFIVTSLGGI